MNLNFHSLNCFDFKVTFHLNKFEFLSSKIYVSTKFEFGPVDLGVL